MKPDNLALRPNCLLTRSPLVFVSGPRSLFSPNKMGSDLQDFILAHGYQMTSPWLPFRGKPQRTAALSLWLEKNKSKSFHFFMAENTWKEMQPVLEKTLHPFSTLNIINIKADTPRSRIENAKLSSFDVKPLEPSLTYRLHQFFCRIMGSQAIPYEQTLLVKDPTLYDRFLDRCIELAENEYKDLNSRM